MNLRLILGFYHHHTFEVKLDFTALVDEVDEQKRQPYSDDTSGCPEGEGTERFCTFRIGGKRERYTGTDHRQVHPAGPPRGRLFGSDPLPESRAKAVGYPGRTERRKIRPRHEDRNVDHGWILA